jgi:hypothetical protein
MDTKEQSSSQAIGILKKSFWTSVALADFVIIGILVYSLFDEGDFLINTLLF